MSAVQVQDTIVNVFRACDGTGTGSIPTKTLVQLMQLLNWSDDRIQDLIGAYGKGNEDTIRYEEFFQWLFVGSVMVQDSSGVFPSISTASASQVPILPALSLDSTHPLTAVLLIPALADRLASLAELLKNDPKAPASVDRVGSLPLHLALRSKQPLEVVTILLQAYPEAAKCKDQFGSLPLHLALTGDATSSEGATYLLRAYPEAASVRDEASGMLPLHLALMQRCSVSFLSFLTALLEAYPDGSLAKAPSGHRPIQLAVYLAHGPDALEELLKAAWKAQLQK